MFPIPRLYLAGIGLALILALAGGLYLKGQHDAAEKAKAAVAASQAAQRQAEVATQALDQHAVRTVVIREREAHAVQIIQQAAGADTALPPAVHRAWLAGMLHDQATHPGERASEPPGTLPPT